MTITLSPEKRAFIEREIAAGGFKSESDAVERALTLYERHLARIREAIAEGSLGFLHAHLAEVKRLKSIIIETDDVLNNGALRKG